MARITEERDLYNYCITKEGRYRFDVLYHGEWDFLINEPEGDLINPQDVSTLTLVADGSLFEFFLNGHPVNEIENDRIQSGQVGISIALFDVGATGTFEFDNFTVKQPAPRE